MNQSVALAQQIADLAQSLALSSALLLTAGFMSVVLPSFDEQTSKAVAHHQKWYGLWTLPTHGQMLLKQGLQAMSIMTLLTCRWRLDFTINGLPLIM